MTPEELKETLAKLCGKRVKIILQGQIAFEFEYYLSYLGKDRWETNDSLHGWVVRFSTENVISIHEKTVHIDFQR